VLRVLEMTGIWFIRKSGEDISCVCKETIITSIYWTVQLLVDSTSGLRLAELVQDLREFFCGDCIDEVCLNVTFRLLLLR
jgi:hypothetical protein